MGFSADDIASLEFETGLAPEPELESVIVENDDSCSDEAQPETELVTPSADELAAKEMFYGFLKGGFAVGNKMITRDDPLGPLKSLDLNAYGPIGRKASDQIFDRLCDIPFVQRLLMNGRLREISQKWGDVIVLFALMKGAVEDEYAVRAKEYARMSAEQQPANDQGGEAQAA